jgi:hypothetical protein
MRLQEENDALAAGAGADELLVAGREPALT